MKELSIVGKSVPRIEGPEKVTGRAKYCTDVVLPGMLHAKVLRSKCPHARILSIDTSEAERLPGVEAVVTAEDTTKQKIEVIVRGIPDFEPLAVDKVRYVGQEVAAVAAEDELIALEVKIDEFQRYLDRGDLRRLATVNTEFHEALYELSRSPRLIKMIHGLRDEIYFLRKIILNSEEMARLSNKDHREIVEAIKKREAKKVERQLREHIVRGKDFVLNEIKKGNVSIG